MTIDLELFGLGGFASTRYCASKSVGILNYSFLKPIEDSFRPLSAEWSIISIVLASRWTLALEGKIDSIDNSRRGSSKDYPKDLWIFLTFLETPLFNFSWSFMTIGISWSSLMCSALANTFLVSANCMLDSLMHLIFSRCGRGVCTLTIGCIVSIICFIGKYFGKCYSGGKTLDFMRGDLWSSHWSVKSL